MRDETSPRLTEFGAAALEHLDALYGYAVALTRDRALAEDLVQETYLRAVRAFGSFAPDTNLKAWLFAIMRNAWLNQLRHERSGPRFVELGEGESEGDGVAAWVPNLGEDPFVAYARKETSVRVRSAIEALPTAYREVVVLRDLEGFSYQQIAAMIGCPIGTVMSRLGRGRERLRAVLGETCAEGTA